MHPGIVRLVHLLILLNCITKPLCAVRAISWTSLPGQNSRLFATLEHLRALVLPLDLFTGIPMPLLHTYAQQVQTEEPHELRRHPEPLRMTLLAAFCHLRQQQVTDTLVDLLIQMIHHVGFQAERRVEHALLQDIKRIANKTGILRALAETVVEHPDERIRDAVFPVVDEQTLHDLVTELRATNLVKRERIQWMMRRSWVPGNILS